MKLFGRGPKIVPPWSERGGVHRKGVTPKRLTGRHRSTLKFNTNFFSGGYKPRRAR